MSIGVALRPTISSTSYSSFVGGDRYVFFLKESSAALSYKDMEACSQLGILCSMEIVSGITFSSIAIAYDNLSMTRNKRCVLYITLLYARTFSRSRASVVMVTCPNILGVLTGLLQYVLP